MKGESVVIKSFVNMEEGLVKAAMTVGVIASVSASLKQTTVKGILRGDLPSFSALERELHEQLRVAAGRLALNDVLVTCRLGGLQQIWEDYGVDSPSDVEDLLEEDYEALGVTKEDMKLLKIVVKALYLQ